MLSVRGSVSKPKVTLFSVFPYLRAVDIFKDLTAEEVEAIHTTMPTDRQTAGTVFYRPEEKGERLFILKEGRVIFYRLTADGKRVLLGEAGPSTVFGEMGLVGQGMYDGFAEAQEDSLVCSLSRSALEELLIRRPQVALRLLELIGRRLRDLEDQMELVAYASVRQRVARVLLKLAAPDLSPREVVGYTHPDLGDVIGALRQTVSEELRRFQDEGLVQVGRKRILLLDEPGLRRAAGL